MIDRIHPERIARCEQIAREALLAERNACGYWTGELSASALSTATAVMALEMVRRGNSVVGGPEDGQGDGQTGGRAQGIEFRGLIDGGLRWLARHQNEDGGWGDTVKSVSNISTTMLAHAVFHATGSVDQFPTSVQRADEYIGRVGGVRAVLARYGKDKTFSIPILTHCALAGQVDWNDVLPFPFELACLPARFYKAVRLPVVSYALPALIAIGQVRHHHRRPWNPLTRLVRRLAVRPSLKVLERIQPVNGGFLEATPLTSFVTMSLAGMGLADHPVARRGIRFIADSVRENGSWPIDTNLATWVTTLSVNALGDDLPADGRGPIREWLLAQQYREVHPYTNADPGGWAWTDLPGGVPDADDTPGAILALLALSESKFYPEAVLQHPKAVLQHPERVLQHPEGVVPYPEGVLQQSPGSPSGSEAHPGLNGENGANPEGVLQESARCRSRQLYNPFRVDRAAASVTQGALRCAARPWALLWNPFGVQAAVDDRRNVHAATSQTPLQDASRFDNALSLDDALSLAVRWLLDLQNRDGGWPTFCRGWGALPFDRSAPDISAHVLRAMIAWLGRGRTELNRSDFCSRTHQSSVACQRTPEFLRIRLPHSEPVNATRRIAVMRSSTSGAAGRTAIDDKLARRVRQAVRRGFRYLERTQRADGSWLPLWFGNQFSRNDENPTYGTARVLAAYRDASQLDAPAARRGLDWLCVHQNRDGGWGGAAGVRSSVEETALAVDALLAARPQSEAAQRGLEWLLEAVEQARFREATPIGFYFAKLWYFESLYPLAFMVAALRRARQLVAQGSVGRTILSDEEPVARV